MSLNQQIIVTAALRIVSDAGLEGLTTRRLGEALGVEGPAIYRHFSNKQELIDEMAATFFQEVAFPRLSSNWSTHLMLRARSIRRTILSCRDGARIIARARTTAVIENDGNFRAFCEAGFTEREAEYAYLAVDRFVIGWTSTEQTAIDRQAVSSTRFDTDDAFEFGLETFIGGLGMRLIQLPYAGDNEPAQEPAIPAST